MNQERQITFRLATDLHDDLVRYAIGHGVTVSCAVRGLIEKEQRQKSAHDGPSR